jgi:hypothetical protein
MIESKPISWSENEELNACLSSWQDVTIEEKGQLVPASENMYLISIEDWHNSLEELKKACPVGKKSLGE